MRSTIILSLFLILFFSCNKDNDQIELPESDLLLKFELNDTEYNSDSLFLKSSIVIPGENDSSFFYVFGKSNNYYIEDSICHGLNIILYSTIYVDSPNTIVNVDSIFKENIRKIQPSYLKYLNKFEPFGVSISLHGLNDTWNSTFIDSVDFEMDQEFSEFYINKDYENDSSIYSGTFSCKLYNNEGDYIEIEQAEFIFEL